MRISKKTLLSKLLFALIAIAVQSCCTKADCGIPSVALELHNFTYDEVDSLIIYRYKKNNRSELLDSNTQIITRPAYQSNSDSIIQVPAAIDWNSDYKLKILSNQHEYWITNFGVASKSCNTCFPFKIQNDDYTYLRSYQVNGNYISGGFPIVIKKQ